MPQQNQGGGVRHDGCDEAMHFTILGLAYGVHVEVDSTGPPRVLREARGGRYLRTNTALGAARLLESLVAAKALPSPAAHLSTPLCCQGAALVAVPLLEKSSSSKVLV